MFNSRNLVVKRVNEELMGHHPILQLLKDNRQASAQINNKTNRHTKCRFQYHQHKNYIPVNNCRASSAAIRVVCTVNKRG